MDYLMRLLGGGTKPSVKHEISDKEFIDKILDTTLFTDSTKRIYVNRLSMIRHELFDDKKSIWWLLHHPEIVTETVIEWGEDHNLSSNTLKQMVTILISVLKHHEEIQEQEPDLMDRWRRAIREITEPVEEHYLSNRPSERQEEGMVTFEQLEEIRDNLPDGSDARLLLSLYTLIPPLRSDFAKVKILEQEPKETLDENYIVLGDVNKLFLVKYKTAKHYGLLEVDLPKALVKQIIESLDQVPREYLFTNRYNQPYTQLSSWNRWANRILKKILDNEKFSLTLFRHIYLSRSDLDLKDMTRKERKEIADKMGHSLDTQDKYRWTAEEEKKEKGKKKIKEEEKEEEKEEDDEQ